MPTNTNKNILTNNEIYEILKAEIVSLELAPGDFIGEVEISKRFHISRTPIREVFKRLEYDGLIRAIRNKGTVITPINFSAITEFMFIREKVEVGIIEEILPSIQPEFIAQLKLALIKQRKVLDDESLTPVHRSQKFFEEDNAFHEILFLAANKSSIWYKLSNYMPDYRRFRSISAELNNEENFKELFLHHTKILESIQEKDFSTIKQIYKTHIYSGVDNLADIISEKENYFVL